MSLKYVREELRKHLKDHDSTTNQFYDRLLYFLERLIHEEVKEQIKNKKVDKDG